MHGLADIVVTAERETQVTHTTADVCTGQILLNPFGSADKVDSLGIMLLHTRSNGQDIGVEDDVERVHTHLLGKNLIGT